jgi:hypothetical protein
MAFAKNSSGGQVLFGGTSTGIVRVFPYPLSSTEYREIPVHNGAINAMRVSEDNFLFTVADDGALFIFKISSNQVTEAKPEVVRRRVIVEDSIALQGNCITESITTL